MSSPEGVGLEAPVGGGAWQSSLEEAEPEERVETRLSGRRAADGGSEPSEGVADGARSVLPLEAAEWRGESEDRGRSQPSETA